MAKTRTAASGSVAPPSPRLTLRLAPVHLDELALIWPANPRIPSVESRRTWALARNILPGTVHHWFSHRRRAADKLCLKIPADTYELAVGTPPIIPVAVTDEPAEIDVSATARKPQNSLKRKLNAHVEPASDDILESERRSRTKKKKADAGASGHNAILQLSTPAPRKATTKNELKIDHVLEEAVPKNSSVKRKRNSDNADAAEPAPPTLQHKQKKKKTSLDLAPLSETTTTTRPEKKKKKFDATSGSEPGAPPSKSTKRKATIGSHAEYVPPSSSPTLVASSPPRSDAYDGPTTSPSFKPTKKSAYIHHPAVLDVPKLSRSVTSTKTNAAALNKTNTSKKSKPSLKKPTLTNSNTSPIPDASTPPQKVNTSKNKLSAPSKRKAKTKATPAPAPTLPEPEPKPESEPEPVCNQGDEAITTGFTCALCAAPTTADFNADDNGDEPRPNFNYVFGFSTAPMDMPENGFQVFDATPLSALTFLVHPVGPLPPAELPILDDGGFRPSEGGFVLDGQQFTYDGTHVGDSSAPFFPVPIPDWSDKIRATGLGSDGMPLEGWVAEEAERQLYDPDTTLSLRLPAFSFPTLDSNSDSDSDSDSDD